MAITDPDFQPISPGSLKMSEFQTVCKLADLRSDCGKTVAVGDRLVAVFLSEGQPCAIDDVCPHMGASLGAGDLVDGIVTCPWHGWRFRVADGTWADNPRIKIGSFPVRVIGDDVQVQIPDPPPKLEITP